MIGRTMVVGIYTKIFLVVEISSGVFFDLGISTETLLVIAIAAGVCLAVIAGVWFYLNRTMNRISSIISDFITKRRIDASDSAETRESKLISQLKQLLRITENEAKASREEKEIVTTLISNLSHQLKTPLANISMYTELLKDSTLTEEERMEFIVRTGEQTAKMEWLMQALFKTSCLETGMIEFEVAPNYIRETMEEGINSVFGQAERKQIQIHIEEFEDCRLLHNPKWTSEAISNVLENAIKYSPEGSCITMKLFPMELYTKIEIIDQGIGIAAEEYHQIFKRFYRSKQVEQKEGSGLGLYLAQLIFTKENGYITVNSTLGKGSCFSLFLLRVRE